MVGLALAAVVLTAVGYRWRAREAPEGTSAVPAAAESAIAVPAVAAVQVAKHSDPAMTSRARGASPSPPSSPQKTALTSPDPRAEGPPSTLPAPSAAAPVPTSAERPGAAAEPTILIDGKWPVREISPGRAIRPSPVEQAPGYYPPHDPEADAVLTGRRVVDLTDLQLSGGASSATALAEAIVDCVSRDDFRRLREYLITFEEFRDILWREFPQSRPATNVPVEDAWDFLFRSSYTGARRMVDDWSGRDLRMTRLSFLQGLTRYTNFNLLLGVRIHARDETTGEEIVIKYADGFVERNGAWKVYTYRD